MEFIINHMPAREVTKRIKDAGYYISRQVAPESNGSHDKYDVYYNIHDSKGELYGDPHDRLWEAREFAIRAVIAEEIGWAQMDELVDGPAIIAYLAQKGK